MSDQPSTLRERLARIQKERPSPALLSLDTPEPVVEIRSSGVIRQTVHLELMKELGPALFDAGMTEDDLVGRVRSTLSEVISRSNCPMTDLDRHQMAQQIADDILGYGPIEPYVRDAEVTEIMVNRHDHIYVEKHGRSTRVAAEFSDEDHLRRTIEKIVSRMGRRVDEAQPFTDTRLPDGSRVNATVPPVSPDGPTLTIRKFNPDPFTAADFIAFKTFTVQVAGFLDACVTGRLNILISSATGAGKTTTLNVLSDFIPAAERIVTIEDSAELRLNQEHVVRLEARPENAEGSGLVTIRDLVRNSLRMKPDRILVGEVRDEAALDMLQAMNTGHDGSLSTIHANSPRDAIARLETLVALAGIDLPARSVRQQIASAVDIILHLQKFRDGSRRMTHVTEVVGMEGEVVTMQDIFLHDFGAGVDSRGKPLGHLRPTGLRPSFAGRLGACGVEVDDAVFERAEQ
ncbi:MAG: CpaF family protein [Candidatus Nanopelagicales bacterium]|nr:CpaF family protein [Candidatus Nanopelagicales bacterium]